VDDVGVGRTDANGRFAHFEDGGLRPGTYRWAFASGEYFAGKGMASFHPEVPVVFTIADATEKYHVPLLLSPFSYTTYRAY
jgi:5-hydroxyisourate hydrolase